MLLGLSFALVSGICLGIFLAPMRFLHGWHWEHIWLVWSIVGMLVGPLLLGAFTIPHMIEVYREAGIAVLILVLIIGAIAGTSGFLYSLSIPVIGLGLATALNAGSSMATALLPLVIVHQEAIKHWSGGLTIAGILIIIGGISFCGKGGSLREQDPGASTKVRARLQTRLTFAKAIAFCVLAGVIASGMNLGLAIPNQLSEIARRLGSSEFGAANAFLMPYMVGGFFSNSAYAWASIHRNHSSSLFKGAQGIQCALWTILMGILFVVGFSSYAAAVAVLGSFGAIIAWGIFGAASILASSLWDVVQKEWSGQAGRVMFRGVALLLIAIVVLGLAQYLYKREGFA